MIKRVDVVDQLLASLLSLCVCGGSCSWRLCRDSGLAGFLAKRLEALQGKADFSLSLREGVVDDFRRRLNTLCHGVGEVGRRLLYSLVFGRCILGVGAFELAGLAAGTFLVVWGTLLLLLFLYPAGLPLPALLVSHVPAVLLFLIALRRLKETLYGLAYPVSLGVLGSILAGVGLSLVVQGLRLSGGAVFLLFYPLLAGLAASVVLSIVLALQLRGLASRGDMYKRLYLLAMLAQGLRGGTT